VFSLQDLHIIKLGRSASKLTSLNWLYFLLGSLISAVLGGGGGLLGGMGVNALMGGGEGGMVSSLVSGLSGLFGGGIIGGLLGRGNDAAAAGEAAASGSFNPKQIIGGLVGGAGAGGIGQAVLNMVSSSGVAG